MIKDYYNSLNQISNEKVLVIGETILDNYFYSESLGTPSKENILSVNFLRKDEYIGGTLPDALNIANLTNKLLLQLSIKMKKLKKNN